MEAREEWELSEFEERQRRRQITAMPPRLMEYLARGAPALVATMGNDGWPNLVMTWAAARDLCTVRFGADAGSPTLANIQRHGKVTLEIIGTGGIIFRLKGIARIVKDRIEAAPFAIAMAELIVSEAKDQSWPGVTVSSLAYEWEGGQKEQMVAMEQAVYAELRDWTP